MQSTVSLAFRGALGTVIADGVGLQADAIDREGSFLAAKERRDTRAR